MNRDLAMRLWAYDPDTGVFTWRVKPAKGIQIGDVTGSPDSDGYLQLCHLKRKYKAHRIAWLIYHGDLPDTEIDHRDRNPGNNRINNLRLATRKQNGENTKSRRDGRFRGVYWIARERAWVVRIKHHKKSISLGYHKCLIDAVAARLRGERALFTHSPANE